MYFHLNKEEFKAFIKTIAERINLDEDIIEKDYYVCVVLRELAKKQENLKAYFKGGTAVYKVLDKMSRFSEDIDLTVKVEKEESNNSNKMRLKRAALNYNIPGLVIQKDKTVDVKQSITAFYKYNTLFLNESNPLHKAGKIQIEATSFTISEPVEKYQIESIIYKCANKEEKEWLKSKYEIDCFDIEVQKLERIFIDKLFAAEFYYERKIYIDFAKHIYDIAMLWREERIQKLLKNRKEFVELVGYKRKEELLRIRGINSEKKITEFDYFVKKFDSDISKAFELMQNKYVFNKAYEQDINIVKKVLSELKDKIKSLE